MAVLLVVTLPAIAVQEEMGKIEIVNGFLTDAPGCSVCINEIMANPSGSEQGEYPNGEWVEIVNSEIPWSHLRDGILKTRGVGYTTSTSRLGLVS